VSAAVSKKHRSKRREEQREPVRRLAPGEAADTPYATGYHAPVLLRETVDLLVTDPAGLYVDGTLGGGGHSAALLNALGPQGRVIGIDRDPEALATARARLADEEKAGRFLAVQGTFADLDRHLAVLAAQQHPILEASASTDHPEAEEGAAPVAGPDAAPSSASVPRGVLRGVLLDLGISSHQIDEPGRGFAFAADGPLDMRMNPHSGESAADLLGRLDRQAIADLLRAYGEEPRAWKIAELVEAARPQTTGALATLVRAAVPVRDEKKSLARTFQALRIAVNDEIGQLEAALQQALDALLPGGRLAVISYHSLEDRRAKRFLRFGNLEGEDERDFYGNSLSPLTPVTRKPVQADEQEVAANPRARSARLRVSEKREVEAQHDVHSG
jgi:16S rRNA (cytosine1402-N4)-methyltransferase